MKQNIIGFKELRENADKYIAAVGTGKRFLVMRKSEPVFVIAPPDDSEDMWETVADFTKIKRGGIKLDEILKRL